MQLHTHIMFVHGINVQYCWSKAVSFVCLHIVITKITKSQHLGIGATCNVMVTQCSPQPFQHSSPIPSTTAYLFDVATKMVDMVTNSAQTMPTRLAFNLCWGELCNG